MYAVFQLSGFQFSAEEGDTIQVPLQNVSDGDKVNISEVMLIKDGETSHIGQPYVADASIEAQVIGRGKGEKVVIHKYKRRTKYRRRQGHRQLYSEIKINKIVAP